MNTPVEILLSTFNGEKFLAMQLDSILQQDYPYWKLLIRDDGSKDGTLSIINSYFEKYPDKITLLNDTEGNIGYSNSFSKLLKCSSTNYVMYCDQDDYWHTSKISSMLSAILEEEINLPGKAHAVFSDLQITDSDLEPISQSFLKKIGYSAKSNSRIFFLRNYVPGCNILFNKLLVEQTLKTKNIIGLHDYWLMMVCSIVGKITCLDKPLMKYRMHDNNAIGFIEHSLTFSKRFSLFIKNILKYGLSNKKYRETVYRKNIEQIKNICEVFPTIVSKDAIALAQVDNSSYFLRKIKNITAPYIWEKTLLKQLTYIICF